MFFGDNVKHSRTGMVILHLKCQLLQIQLARQKGGLVLVTKKVKKKRLLVHTMVAQQPS